MIEILLSGLLWRLRGIIGWPGTLAFGLVQAWALWPVFSGWSLLSVPVCLAVEPWAWKPKNWNLPAWTKWEPNIKVLQNPKPFYLPFWSAPKYLLNWRGAWNEVYFGLLFNSMLQIIAVIEGLY